MLRLIIGHGECVILIFHGTFIDLWQVVLRDMSAHITLRQHVHREVRKDGAVVLSRFQNVIIVDEDLW